MAQGVTRDRVNLGNLLKFRVPVPPLPEQRQIAEVLDTVDEAIRKTEAILAKLKQVKQGLLHDLLTRGIDENGELRDPLRHPEQFKDSAPVGWSQQRLVDAVAFPRGQVDPRHEPFRSMILVAPDHIDSCTGRLLAQVSAAEQGAISGKYLFEPGDVVYSKIRPYLRKVVRVDFHGLSSADMYPLRAQRGLDSRFLLHLLLGEHFSRFAEIVSMRSGFPKINRTEFGEYTAALPPLPEQRQIAEVLDTADEAIRKTEAILVELKQVKKGLMEDLLTGRIRVTPLLSQKKATK